LKGESISRVSLYVEEAERGWNDQTIRSMQEHLRMKIELTRTDKTTYRSIVNATKAQFEAA
jgi:hypothetical protein